MPLDKLEKDLYNPNSDIENREHDKSSFNINETIGADKDTDKFEEVKRGWDKHNDEKMDEGRKKILIIGASVIGVILLISIIAVVVTKLKQNAFSQSRVSVSIEGNTEAGSGQEVSYTIKYENNNRATLENVEIVLNHSENFYPNEGDNLSKYSDRSSKINIGKLKAKAKGEIEISGKFYAAEDYTIYLQPVMTYKPDNSSSEFRAESQLGVKITTSPIELEIEAPKEALDESTVEYKIKYANKGVVSFDSLNLRLEYSDGFIFQGANPSPVNGNNVWHLGSLNSGEENTVTIQGKIKGNRFDAKTIKATVYRNESGQTEVIFGKAEDVTKVVVPPLTINHKINDQNSLNVNLGDTLNYEINYANKGEIALRDIIVKLKIDSPIINYSNLNLKTGAYESKTKTITWKASDISQLENMEPGDSGIIKLQIPIKNRVDINSDSDKNFSIESVVIIDSSDVAFHSLGASKNISNKVIANLNSRVILEQEAFFNDSSIENSGPIPPKVGEETSYAIHWKISSISNDVSSVKVGAYLPTWVKWKGNISPDNENIDFNERTQEVVWNIDKIENGTGVLSDPKEVIFQVSIVPEVNQIKEDVPIITKTFLEAKDDFTLSSIKETVDDQTTRIEDDKSVPAEGYQVVE